MKENTTNDSNNININKYYLDSYEYLISENYSNSFPAFENSYNNYIQKNYEIDLQNKNFENILKSQYSNSYNINYIFEKAIDSISPNYTEISKYDLPYLIYFFTVMIF